MKDLRKDTTNINDGLTALNAKALALENLVLPAELAISIGDIHYLPQAAFRPTPQTVAYYLYSTELYRNLKEMNRNSNNFVAEKIFKKLSENEDYLDFIVKRLGISVDEINIQNGSGYPIYIDNQKFYNQASCAAVVEMLDDLRQSLRADGLDCKDIMPVAGKDTAADGDSTVTQIYGSELTSGTLIGKTGSVLDTIALAGMVSTENENVFFQTSFHVDESPEDRALAYSKIRFWLANELLKNKKKSDLDKYQPKAFMAFDGGSKLQRIIPLKRLY